MHTTIPKSRYCEELHREKLQAAPPRLLSALNLDFQLLFNQVKADDFKSGNIQQLNRNLSFKSSVVEFGPVLEIDFFKFHPGQNNTAKAAFGTPYFMGGINIMRMNPKTRYNGEWIELQPLGTEGQGTSLTCLLYTSDAADE